VTLASLARRVEAMPGAVQHAPEAAKGFDSIRFDSIRFDDDREGRAGWIASQRAMDGDGRDGGEDAVVDVDARCDETKRV
jgi:hypothetical protein